ncbi:MAG: hypothetical protein H8D23_31490 [Candidatus Brocadiales bacterium]|nr:hypothetical protein [Candidatus Brocadiales bacterium]
MTTQRYILLLVGTFAYLFAFVIMLSILTSTLDFEIKQYRVSILLILLTYPMVVITTSSYLLGRAIFTPKKIKVNKTLLVATLLLTFLIIEVVFHKIYLYKEHLTDWQYSIHSIILITGLVIFPMFLAKPNKFFLRLTALFHKGF